MRLRAVDLREGVGKGRCCLDRDKVGFANIVRAVEPECRFRLVVGNRSRYPHYIVVECSTAHYQPLSAFRNLASLFDYVAYPT